MTTLEHVCGIIATTCCTNHMWPCRVILAQSLLCGMGELVKYCKVEHHRAVAASVKQLSEHESERSAACGNAETEFEARTSVLSGLELECAQMVSARRQAAEELRMSTAALDTHTKDVSDKMCVVGTVIC